MSELDRTKDTENKEPSGAALKHVAGVVVDDKIEPLVENPNKVTRDRPQRCSTKQGKQKTAPVKGQLKLESDGKSWSNNSLRNIYQSLCTVFSLFLSIMFLKLHFAVSLTQVVAIILKIFRNSIPLFLLVWLLKFYQFSLNRKKKPFQYLANQRYSFVRHVTIILYIIHLIFNSLSWEKNFL